MRVHHDRIRPLELWDALTPAGTLWESMEHVDFASHLGDVLNQLLAGTAHSRADGPIQQVAFDHIWLSGGRLLDLDIVESLTTLPRKTFIATDARFPGIAAATKILPDCANSTLCIDVGQTSIKISQAEHRLVVARDYEEFPIRQHGNDTPSPQNQQRFLQWLIKSIQTIPASLDDNTHLLLSLPCEITNDCTLGGSSYIGVIGCKDTIPVLKETLQVNSVYLLNDAELAAWSALADPRLPLCGNTLVLTLGFGVGAAVILDENA